MVRFRFSVSGMTSNNLSVICKLIQPDITRVPCRQPASDVAECLGGGFLYGVNRPGNGFELIPTVKMETRLPVEGSCGYKFPSFYNHCGLMAA